MKTARFEIASTLAASPRELWEHATSVGGITWELAPWLRMSVPRGFSAPALERLVLPARFGKSWILLGGLVPFDWDDLCIVELEPGRRFLERSTMLSMRLWQHERTVEADRAGCRVVDRLEWQPRALVPDALARRIVEALFRHRHARLAARFPA